MMRIQPQGLQFETNTVCNARCTFCQYQAMVKRPAMPWSVILDILYYHAHTVSWVCPFGMQEPLLEPRLAPILASTKQFNPHILTTIYSNMSIFPQKTWESIIKYQLLDTVAVSFYGVDKPTYEQMQPPLNYNQTRRNIKRLVKLRNRMGWRKPEVNMHLLVTKDTYRKANAFQREWSPIVDEVGFVHYDAWGGAVEDWDNDFEQRIWGDAEPKRVPCHRLWTTMTIRSTGEVVPCCLDHNIEIPCGTIQDDPQMWYTSPTLNEMRLRHLRGEWDAYKLCRACSIWRRETPKEWITNWRKLAPVLSAALPTPKPSPSAPNT